MQNSGDCLIIILYVPNNKEKSCLICPSDPLQKIFFTFLPERRLTEAQIFRKIFHGHRSRLHFTFMFKFISQFFFSSVVFLYESNT